MTGSALCVLLLMIVAAIVTALQYVNGRRDKSLMWLCIVLYWFILTVKNFCDLQGL